MFSTGTLRQPLLTSGMAYWMSNVEQWSNWAQQNI